MIITQKFTDKDLRCTIDATYRIDETQCVDGLLTLATLTEQELKRAHDVAYQLVEGVRAERLGQGGLDAFLYEYDLSTEEGIALMCIAEAMLRIPDTDTVNKLIADKISSANWERHLGDSQSLFVNTATWALMLTGKVVIEPNRQKKAVKHTFKRLIKRSGEPIIRTAVAQAMRILGRQFVMGRTIKEAVKRAESTEQQGYRYSYDMLGEAARTEEDAERYFQAYQQALEVIAQHNQAKSPIEAADISVKLSALHPRYHYSQRDRVLKELTAKVLQLAQQASQANISLTIDAEETERLDLSLDIIERVFTDPSLKDWQGFGLAVQAYQKRAMPVINWLIELAKQQGRRIMVRLVKGAYWDTEIKLAQVEGLENYPVFTRKTNTDVSYLACVRKLLAAHDTIYPRFATHNAYSVAAVLAMLPNSGRDRHDFEFQCLHGMGQTLYNQIIVETGFNLPCRIYAPVGNHKDLLPYLVRRLLENGANSSFVNRIVDANMPIESIIEDPVEKVISLKNKAHAKIPLPKHLYGLERVNSQGFDFSSRVAINALSQRLQQSVEQLTYQARPTVDDPDARVHPMINPSTGDVLGQVYHASNHAVEQSLKQASKSAIIWGQLTLAQRAEKLLVVADLLQQHHDDLMSLLILEAGKTVFDAEAEIREAIDFCRYYAQQATLLDSAQSAYGVIVCISPWNFPLAIFLGQISAALVTGNSVIAKPAEQTSLIADYTMHLLHQAGIPKNVVQLLPGEGARIGAQLTQDERVNGVMFTGSTETAQLINQSLAQRPGNIPLIAETGGQNAMIVDSSALIEQVVDDVIISAFGSAGQRCSALRVLFVQADIADDMITMLRGAMAELSVGDPKCLAHDVGPVIDEAARQQLIQHTDYLKQVGQLIYQVSNIPQQGMFFAPCAYEIKTLDVLKREVFGPILHIIRYPASSLDTIIQDINATGYGLTLGIHSRIESTIKSIYQQACVGNIYVNRNMIGAVVGVQPFGGEGLSGTGPKAGGPHYLARLRMDKHQLAQLQASTISTSEKSNGVSPSFMRAHKAYRQARFQTLQEHATILLVACQKLHGDHHELIKLSYDVLTQQQLDDILSRVKTVLQQTINQYDQALILPGPTGEMNQLSLHPRGVILIVSSQLSTFACNLVQLITALVIGNSVIMKVNKEAISFWQLVCKQFSLAGLEADRYQVVSSAQSLGTLLNMPQLSAVMVDTIDAVFTQTIKQQLAQREGAIIPLVFPRKDEHYIQQISCERTLTINTTASGGNAALLSLQAD